MAAGRIVPGGGGVKQGLCGLQELKSRDDTRTTQKSFSDGDAFSGVVASV